MDAPAKLFDIGAHDVHADAAPRDCGHRIAARQAGVEDEVELGGMIHRGGLAGGQDLLRPGLLDQSIDVDAAAVVGDFDEDLVARLTRGDDQAARFALARRAAIRRRLDTMVDRIADDVEQGIAHQLDHLAIQLDVGALNGQCHKLAELPGGIADHARQGGE